MAGNTPLMHAKEDDLLLKVRDQCNTAHHQGRANHAASAQSVSFHAEKPKFIDEERHQDIGGDRQSCEGAGADLSTQIAIAIKPGDRVTVHGLHAAALPMIRAVSITDEVTHRTVSDSNIATDAPPPRPAPPRDIPPRAASAPTETSGRVRLVLHGAQGEPNGVLLESGALLRFPPDQTAQPTSLLQPRQQLVAEGTAITNAIGTVVDAQQLGPSRDRLIGVGLPGPMDDRGPAGPQRRPAPAARTPPPPAS
jgi:hypothetical protein